ncbi:hypothetical protein NDU88_003353 [Pleurodeles waltl]|uniref:Uncharacterized protein n=1 Tax=Pleurodeles waltl TaxID=8319 RepID=A0AAV7NKG5_PLEWA|nr:hypothetical protein NDU88_003353 [Pleurodeles waltl]
MKRTVTVYSKCWDNYKHRTKEKLAKNLKAAMQIGGGSPVPQEELDALEEWVAAVIPVELVAGVPRQDSAAHEEQPQTQGEYQ